VRGVERGGRARSRLTGPDQKQRTASRSEQEQAEPPRAYGRPRARRSSRGKHGYKVGEPGRAVLKRESGATVA
jgi:hypothetical protein